MDSHSACPPTRRPAPCPALTPQPYNSMSLPSPAVRSRPQRRGPSGPSPSHWPHLCLLRLEAWRPITVLSHQTRPFLDFINALPLARHRGDFLRGTGARLRNCEAGVGRLAGRCRDALREPSRTCGSCRSSGKFPGSASVVAQRAARELGGRDPSHLCRSPGASGMWQAMEHRAEDEARGDEATFDHLRNPRLLGKPRIRKASRPAGKISPRAPPVRLSHGHGGPALGESLIDTQTLRARGLVWALHRWKHPDGSAKGQALLAHPGVGGPVLGKDVSVPICKTGAWLGPPAAQLHGPYNSAAGSTAAPVSQVGNRVRGRGPVLGSHGEDAAGVWPARSLRAGAAARSPASPVTRHQPPAASRSPSPSTSPPHDI